MWNNNDNEPIKGLWQILNEPAAVIQFPDPSTYTLEDMCRDMERLQKKEDERRAWLDTQYAPIENISDKDIEDAARPYGDNIPIGLFIKVKMAGRYMDIPLKVLVAMKEAAHRMYEKQNSEKGVQECDATDDDSSK